MSFVLYANRADSFAVRAIFLLVTVKGILESSRRLSYSLVIGYEKFSRRAAWNSQFVRIHVYVNSLSTRGPNEYLWPRYAGYIPGLELP